MTEGKGVRLPEHVYRPARNMADNRGISINRLIQEAIAEKAEVSVGERLRRAYDLLAEDPSGAEATASSRTMSSFGLNPRVTCLGQESGAAGDPKPLAANGNQRSVLQVP